MKAVTVRFEQGALEDVDRVRRLVPREAWIRQLCADAVTAHDMTLGYREGPMSHGAEGGGSEVSRRAPGAMVRQPRPIVGKRGQGK